MLTDVLFACFLWGLREGIYKQNGRLVKNLFSIT